MDQKFYYLDLLTKWYRWYERISSIKGNRAFRKNGANVQVNDPYIPEFKHKGKLYKSPDLEKGLEEADIVIITTNHSCYDYEHIVEKAKILYDTRNATKDVKNNREKIHKL